MYAVEAEDLTKSFGSVVALSGVNFKVDQREIYGLIGPNGAGKTTTLRIVATLIKPTSGTVRILGNDVVRDASNVRGLISYLPEEAGAYKNISGIEYLNFMAGFYTKDQKEAGEMIQEASRISGLAERLRDKTKTYSKGMLRRLLLSRALMIRPKLAILDEPTGGLDVVHAHHIRNSIREYTKIHDVSVILSSHNMLEVEFLCDRVAMINAGKIVDEGTPDELKKKHGASNLEEAFVKVAHVA